VRAEEFSETDWTWGTGDPDEINRVRPLLPCHATRCKISIPRVSRHFASWLGLKPGTGKQYADGGCRLTGKEQSHRPFFLEDTM
jgi:hypothetical protein